MKTTLFVALLSTFCMASVSQAMQLPVQVQDTVSTQSPKNPTLLLKKPKVSRMGTTKEASSLTDLCLKTYAKALATNLSTDKKVQCEDIVNEHLPSIPAILYPKMCAFFIENWKKPIQAEENDWNNKTIGFLLKAAQDRIDNFQAALKQIDGNDLPARNINTAYIAEMIHFQKELLTAYGNWGHSMNHYEKVRKSITGFSQKYRINLDFNAIEKTPVQTARRLMF